MTQDPDPLLAATQVGHAMNMIAELPPHTADSSLPAVLRAAAFESFFVNMRLLLEFLVMRRDLRSIHRHDYLPDWDPEPSATVRRMRKYDYRFVCDQVSHLSKKRITRTGAITVNIPLARLRELAGAVFDEMERFALALREAGSEELAETFESYVRQARTRAASG